MKSRISSKGQITVPVQVREVLGLTPGTAVEFLVREGEAVLRKRRQGADPVDRVYGRLRAGRRARGRDARPPAGGRTREGPETPVEKGMRTAIDTSVLLDVFGADPQHGERSREALRAAYRAGALLVCDVVWAEVRAHFAEDGEFREMLGLLGARFDPVSAETSALAGRLWREHRARSRARGARVVADFLVGAHARLQADALLTRDRGFYRRCFSKLRIRPFGRMTRPTPPP